MNRWQNNRRSNGAATDNPESRDGGQTQRATSRAGGGIARQTEGGRRKAEGGRQRPGFLLVGLMALLMTEAGEATMTGEVGA